MKLTLKQLKQLIKEAISESNVSERYSGDLGSVLQQFKLKGHKWTSPHGEALSTLMNMKPGEMVSTHNGKQMHKVSTDEWEMQRQRIDFGEAVNRYLGL